ncbi:MAG: aminopeptidase [Actinomycetota bacterium]|nr:aminopeptidase [Actinomycetota bacterium]
MAVQRLLRPVALMVLLAGAIVLLAPVSVGDGDGGSIGCGNAVAADFSAALDANAESVATAVIAGQGGPHTNYVAGCRSSLSTRRAWVIALVAIGAIAAAAGFTT